MYQSVKLQLGIHGDHDRVYPSLTLHIFHFYSETTEGISTKLDRKQNSKSSTKFEFFGA